MKTGKEIKTAMIAAVLCTALSTQAQTPFDASKFVTIGHPGNAPDTAYPYGAVDYEYKIGKYEVSVTDWDQFYNDPGSGKIGELNPAYESWRIVSGEQAPACRISFNQAAQYCNWLTTGNAKKGAYKISPDGSVESIDRDFRNDAELVYVLPTENEWYKAAFFKPDGSGYSLYANGESTPPPQSADAKTGWRRNDTTPWAVNLGTVEQNGTYNMMGSMWEWVEALNGVARGRGEPPAKFRLTSKRANFEGSQIILRIVVLTAAQ